MGGSLQTTTEAQIKYSVTREDLRAMREADFAIASYNRASGMWKLCLGKRQTTDAIWTEDGTGCPSLYLYHDVRCDPRHCAVYDYTRTPSMVTRDVVSAYAHVDLYRHSPWPRCAVLQIRQGDVLGLRFVADRNAYMMGAGLLADVCYLRIIRKGKAVAEYPVASIVTPDARLRMVTYEQKGTE